MCHYLEMDQLIVINCHYFDIIWESDTLDIMDVHGYHGYPWPRLDMYGYGYGGYPNGYPKWISILDIHVYYGIGVAIPVAIHVDIHDIQNVSDF